MKQTVYIASPESQQIHVWRLGSQGSLSLLQVVDVPGQVQPMALHPSKDFLYVGVRPEFRVIAYRIAPEEGTLTEAGEAPLSGSPTHISTDHLGRFLFSASYNAGTVSVVALDKDGLPTETVAQVDGLEGCHSANISPDNRTLWVPALKQDRICLFTLTDEGQLAAHTPAQVETAKGAGPRHMAFHPNQHYAYCVNELNSKVDVWRIQDNPEFVQSIDMMPPDFNGTRWAADIHLTPDGRHLYVCDRTASIITYLSVSESGDALTVVGYQPTETQPRGFNIDSSGKYLIATGQKSHHITLYQITGSQGALEEKGRYEVGEGPMWVTIKAH